MVRDEVSVDVYLRARIAAIQIRLSILASFTPTLSPDRHREPLPSLPSCFPLDDFPHFSATMGALDES